MLYEFDESTSSTSAAETHSSGLDLTLSGANISSSNTLDSGLGLSWDSGNALYCDGTTAIATHGDNNTFEPNDFTISMWVYSDDFSSCNGNCTLVSKGVTGTNPAGYWVYTDASGNLSVDIGNGGSGTTITGGSLTVTTWHHVVVTLKNWTVSMYVDGQIAVLQNMSHYIAYGAQDFILCGIDSSTAYFKGYIDEFRFWDGDKSSTEVSEMYDWYTDSDGDGYNASDDCDMDEATTYPSADEYCDGVDNDCDGSTDENDALDASTWYLDDDSDGYGDYSATTAACSQPTGYVSDATDCDDTVATTYPGSTEYCDGTDNDCDGSTDEDDAFDADTWYADSDSDSYGDPSTTTTGCSQPSGYVADYTDCDDTDSDTNPGASEYCDSHDDDCDGLVDENDAVDALTWYADTDSDGYGDPSASAQSCGKPSNYVSDNTDCNDSAFGINPGVDEYCDGHDDDCDGLVDEEGSVDAVTYYADADSDGYGDISNTTDSCTAPTGYVSDDSDCDDSDSSINPSGVEVCDTLDNDCDGSIDDDSAADVLTWYADTDGDGFGDISSTDIDCAQPSGFVSDSTDCDDSEAATYPGAAEYCDTIDNNCDNIIDEDSAVDALTWHRDADADGYGDPGATTLSCSQPSGFLTDSADCDDANNAIYPGATEYCDSTDWDCDGDTYDDEASDALTWYADLDLDGFGDLNNTAIACFQPSGYLSDNTDCDDTSSATYPGATEIWYDDIDENCDGLSDFDQDGDGFDHVDYEGEDCDDEDKLINPDATEIWYDGTDQDCDGLSDYDYDGDGFDSETYGGDDCDDSDADTYPGAPDTPYDGLIFDCNHTSDYDADSDGWDTYLFGGGDCDDNNSAVNPDIEEIWYDGIDQNCDDNDDDQDWDGFPLDEDCDDEDPDLYPNAPGLDEDCNPIDTGDTGEAPGDTATVDTGDEPGKDDGGGGSFPTADDGGCACSQSPSPQANWIWMLLGVLFLGRRQTQRDQAS